MSRPLQLLALVWVPFLSIFAFASPAVVERYGDSAPHVAFHLVSLMLLGAAIVLVARMRRESRTRAQRASLAVAMVTVPLAVLGSLTELVAALTRYAADGWVSRRTPEMFGADGGLHAVGANLTIPALLVSMLAALVLTVLTRTQGRRAADRAETAQTG